MKYNHMFDVAFSVENDHEDGNDTPVEELIAGLEKRIESLKREGAVEAFGLVDSYDVD